MVRTLVNSSSSSAVDLDFDYSVFIQMGLFVFLLLVLKPLLFDPILKLFKERERLTEETVRHAHEIDAESAVAKDKYDAAMASARKDAGAERDRLRNEGVKKEAEILATAREKTVSDVDAGRKSAQLEASSVKAALEASSRDLAKELASRVLGREVTG